jgi:hypothetical protein
MPVWLAVNDDLLWTSEGSRIMVAAHHAEQHALTLFDELAAEFDVACNSASKRVAGRIEPQELFEGQENFPRVCQQRAP